VLVQGGGNLPNQIQPPSNAIFAGIQVQDLTERLRSRANIPANINGVLVIQVDPESSSAQQIQPGDVIEEVNRKPVKNIREFEQVVGQLESDQPVVVGIARNRQRSFVVITP
jgi:serine protease Do